MCGLAGFLELSQRTNSDELTSIVARMISTLTHRGPDDQGVWTDSKAGVALGFRRLSILDLSPTGNQPMLSHDGRWVVVFNGEIYNFEVLRRELAAKGHMFRGRSDTEVLLASISEWGVEPAVSRFNGMFAFALWDRKERRLHLVRDRMGEKPLYYGRFGEKFLFGSELKALRAHPAFKAEIDREALTLYLRYGCIPAPYSIYRGIRKVPPATILWLDAKGTELETQSIQYWSVRQAVQDGFASRCKISKQESIEELENLLRDSVKLRMISDVPLGAFLSGGIDSSIVVSMMQAQSQPPVKTFSIGFQQRSHNEADSARAVAAHLRTSHTEHYVSPEEAMSVIPVLPSLYDEPFADSSQIPTYLVSRLARQHVTVSLSGDGGDELFGGYNRHVWGPKIWKRFGWLPQGLRRVASNLLNAVPPEKWDKLFLKGDKFLTRQMQHRTPGNKLQKLSEAIMADNFGNMYLSLTSHWKKPAIVVIGGSEPDSLRLESTIWNLQQTEFMMFLDSVSYLPNDILVKLDRASMGVSLEARVPFLDHRLVEFAWKMPLQYKIRDGQGKWILRQLLKKYVPPVLTERPKSGFSLPLGSWLRNPLREWAESLLCEERLKNEGFFDPRPIRSEWQEHLSGGRNYQDHLWIILMFETWLESQSG